jgi:hypothetical protein
MKCDLCHRDEAEPGGQLCMVCGEAIARLRWAQARIDAMQQPSPRDKDERVAPDYRAAFGGG